jgi:hypothetical protein
LYKNIQFQEKSKKVSKSQQQEKWSFADDLVVGT